MKMTSVAVVVVGCRLVLVVGVVRIFNTPGVIFFHKTQRQHEVATKSQHLCRSMTYLLDKKQQQMKNVNSVMSNYLVPSAIIKTRES